MGNQPTFAEWLKQRRKDLGLTQRELAQRASCAEITLRKIEAGDLQPSTHLAAALVKSLGVADTAIADGVALALGAGDHPPWVLSGSRSHRPNNLPHQLTPLIGRDHDSAVVRRRLLDGARLITLTGPPGVGKTRLALAVAEAVLEQMQHGVFFVRLEPISDPNQVIPAIVQALGFKMSGPTPPLAQLRIYLEARHLLLILDNFEHVLETAPLVDDLLRRCPWLYVLATSRQPLRVRGERQIPVLPLALPAQSRSAAQLTANDMVRYPAVALFEDRAQAVQPGFAVTDANAAVIAELCRRLDGLPLAIELVAARITLLPPEDLLAHLRGPWMLSVDGLRAVPARQRTLRGAIGWSYDLLSPAEQSLLAHLSVFAGGFTLEAAEAVCAECEQAHGSSFQVLDGLASLLDKSLLRRERGPAAEARYSMLETIREFALERLATSGKAMEAKTGHLAWCLKITAPALSAPFFILEQPDAQVIDAEIQNLGAGLEWALDHDGSAAMRLIVAVCRTVADRGSVREAQAWIDRALALPEAGEITVERAALMYCKGIAEFLAGQIAVAEMSFAKALAQCRSLNERSGQAGAQFYLGRIAALAGSAERAEADLEAAASALLEANEIVDWGHVISTLAEIVMFRGDLQRSRVLHTEALTRVLAPEQRHHLFRAVGGLAELTLVEGDYPTAQRLAEECLALCRQKDSPAETAWPLTCLGEIAIRRGDFAAAHTRLNEALALGRSLQAHWRVILVRADFGDLAVAEGHYDEALGLYRETLPILLQRGILVHPQGSLRLACLAGAVGQHEVAATLLGACSAAVENGHEVLYPITQADFDAVLVAAQAALDADAFEAAWTAGRALSPQAAVTWGLQAIYVSGQ